MGFALHDRLRREELYDDLVRSALVAKQVNPIAEILLLIQSQRRKAVTFSKC